MTVRTSGDTTFFRKQQQTEWFFAKLNSIERWLFIQLLVPSSAIIHINPANLLIKIPGSLVPVSRRSDAKLGPAILTLLLATPRRTVSKYLIRNPNSEFADPNIAKSCVHEPRTICRYYTLSVKIVRFSSLKIPLFLLADFCSICQQSLRVRAR